MNTGLVVAVLSVGILNGEPTRDFPECVAVGGPNAWCCSGTLIAPNAVVTAGYCAPECAARVFVGSRVGKEGEEFRVLKVIIHPQRDAEHMKNDLAVLILDRDVPSYRPLSRASSSLIDHAGVLRVVGFGLSEEMGGYGVKRFADIPVVTATSTGAGDEERFGSHPDREMVAKDPAGAHDSNNGDGGGPAYVRDPEGRWRLAAVVSRATKDSVRPSGDGGIYLRLDRYWDWIRQVVLDNGGHRPNHP